MSPSFAPLSALLTKFPASIHLYAGQGGAMTSAAHAVVQLISTNSQLDFAAAT